MGKACPLTSSNWASAGQLDGKTGSRAARRWEKRESGKARPLWASKSGLSEFEVAEWKVGCGWRDLIVYLWKGLSQLFCVWSKGRGTGTHFINHANAYRLTSSRSCFSSKSPSQIVAIICLTCWKSNGERCECENAPCMTRPGPIPKPKVQAEAQTTHQNHWGSACWPLPCRPAFFSGHLWFCDASILDLTVKLQGSEKLEEDAVMPGAVYCVKILWEALEKWRANLDQASNIPFEPIALRCWDCTLKRFWHSKK